MSLWELVLIYIVRLAPFWLPALLIWLLCRLWLYYVRAKYLNKLETILLEIKVPRDVFKTPQAMEVALTALYQTFDNDNLLIGNWIKGQQRNWFSLELVSIDGQIHFYIWTPKFHKNIIEAQFYSQYPGIEITEAEDYTNKVPYDLPGSDWKLWGAEFKLAKADAYPIKTYIQYGLDKEQEEENKTDPFTATLEFLGTMRPGEQLWIQILVMAAKDRYHKPGTWFEKQSWQDEAKGLVEKLSKRDKAADDGTGIIASMLSPGERRVLDEVEKSIGKLGFDCGIRAVYLAKKDLFHPRNIVGTLGCLKHFNSPELNGFKTASNTGIKYPWQDPFGTRVALKKALHFDAYRRRAYFYPPYKKKPFVLNTEELATIFHFPGRVAATPSLPKIESKRGEPPAALPV